MVLKEALE